MGTVESEHEPVVEQCKMIESVGILTERIMAHRASRGYPSALVRAHRETFQVQSDADPCERRLGGHAGEATAMRGTGPG